MNKSEFLNLIKRAKALTEKDANDLEKLAQVFPYCQTAHYLIAKASCDSESMLASQKLRRAALYAVNRKKLKTFITSDLEVRQFHYEPEYINSELTETNIETETQSDILINETEESVLNALEAVQESATAIEEFSQDLLLEEISLPSTDTSVEIDDSAEIEAELQNLIPKIFQGTEPIVEEVKNLAEQHEEIAPVSLDTQQLPEAAFDDAPNEVIASELSSVTEVVNPFVPESEENLISNIEEFKPSQDSVQTDEKEPEFDIKQIFIESQLGYWMNSSRMGECIQVKNEFTSEMPFHFSPELINEHQKSKASPNSTSEDTLFKEQKVNEKPKQSDIIDLFLKMSPKIKAVQLDRNKTEPQEDLSSKSTKIKNNLASENLANIFLKQGKHKKAIKIYEQLILKYPEKKGYFVDKIEEIQNLK